MSDCYKNILVIAFSHFKDSIPIGKEVYDEFLRYIYYDIAHDKNLQLKNGKEREKLEKQIILKEKEILIKKTKVLYYQIDEKKNNEIKEFLKTTNSHKNKIEANLNYSKLGDKIIIHGETNYEIKEKEVKDIICLDNKDVILELNKEINIYRLENNIYKLLQKIKTTNEEYGEQYETYFVGCTKRRTEKIAYYFDSMKKLSGNRFVLISSYGLLFYGLNEENKYSLISKKLYRNKILIFHELNENNFLLGADIYIRFGMGGPAHNNFLIERLNLNKNLDDKSALKFNCSISTLYEFDTHGDTYTETYNINDEFILNNKYFIALLDYYLIVVDIFNEKSKKYLICENSEETLCKYSQARLIKKNDNELEFLIVRDNQNTLFKLIENDKSFDLKIIGYYNK